MASVHRRQKSPYWWAAFRESGKLIFRSTKSRDRAVAERIADAWEQASKKAVAGTLIEAQARKILSEIMERAGVGESLRTPTARDYFAGWLEQKAAAKSTATAARYAGTIRQFLDHLGPLADRPVTAIRTEDVQRFLNSRSKIRSTKTVLVDSKSLAAAFASGVRSGVLDRNVALPVELPKVVSVERKVFTADQVTKLLRVAPPDWKTAILAGFYLGARIGDVVNLTWESVDLGAGLVEYRQRKTDSKTISALHPALLAHLNGISGGREGFIMPSLAGRLAGGNLGLSSEFTAIMAAAGLDEKRTEMKSGRSFAALSFHSLRHTFESELANAGVSAELRREMSGRASEAVQRAYTHLQLETLRNAAAKLPDLSISGPN